MADKSLIGRSMGVGSVEVEKGRLHFFAKAIGETDKVYTDEAAAKDAGHKSLPVPPTFLMCLNSECGRDFMETLNLFEFDVSRILHAEQGFIYHKVAYAGDTLTFETTVADVHKKTGGAKQFIMQQTRVTNQNGEHVADVRSSLVHRNG
jgi:acyl dehydratase